MKRKLSVLLVFVLLTSMFFVGAQADSSDFTISNGVLTGYSGLGGAVTIPSGVTGIGANAFQYCGEITSVVIPSGVTSIGSYAFRGCEALKTITIPGTVSSIGSNAFEDCIGLTNIALPTSLKAIPDYAFADCVNLGEVYIPYGVTSIGSYAFSGCIGLTSLSVPYSVSSISKTAFVGCDNLTNLSLPSRFNTKSGSIGSTASWTLDSYGCLTITGSGVLSVSEIPWLAYKDSVRSVVIGSGITGIGDVFAHHNKITSVSLPNTLTAIGDRAFMDCSSLTSVAFPNSLKSIGANAFHGCSSLTSITYGSGLTSIGLQAFSDCTSLSSLALPESVMTIGDAAYSGCSAMTTAYIPSSTGSIGRNIFIFCPRLTRVNVNSSNAAYCGVDGILYNKSKTEVICCPAGKSGSVTLDANVTTIAPQAFFGCSGITSVTAGTALNEIDGYAFGYCTSLSSITLPDSVALIDGTAFHGCSSLTAKVGKNSYAETFCKNHNIRYTYTVPTVISASFDGDAVVGRPVGITVETLTSASYVKMFSEGGAAAAVWSSGYTDSGNRRVWHLKYTFSGEGDRKMTFKASSDNATYGSGVTAVVTIRQQKENDVLDVRFDGTAKVTKPVGITVVTTSSAKYIRMYSEGGQCVKTWSGTYTDESGKRIWKLEYIFAGEGTRQLTFKASCDGQTYGDGVTVQEIVAAPGANEVLTAAFEDKVYGCIETTVTVTTSTAAKSIAMYNESGKQAAVWSSGYTDSGSIRTWKVKYAFDQIGAMNMAFKASADNTVYGSAVNAAVNVLEPNADVVFNAYFASDARTGDPVNLTVVTSTKTRSVTLCAENGARVKSWTTGYSDSGIKRTWNVEYTFASAGTRKLSVKASGDGAAYGSGYPVQVVVTEPDPTEVFDAVFVEAPVEAGVKTVLSVKTPTTTKYVRLCAENGGTAKTWSSGYTDSGKTRTWTLEYTFANAGSRKLSVKASKDNVNYGTGLPVNVEVCPRVTNVVFPSTAAAGKTVNMTVTTSTNAKYVKLCDDNGKVLTTATTGYSDSASGRVWSVPVTPDRDGTLKYTVFASYNGKDYSTGKTVSVTINSGVLSVVFENSYAGEDIPIRIVTTKGAKYVAMYAENGGFVRKWSSGYTDSGDQRIWNISYKFASGGKRTLTFKASADGSVYGVGKSATVTLVPRIKNAAFTGSAVVGKPVTLKVVTSTAAKYVTMYAENGGLVKKWSSGYTDSGSERTWVLSYTFAGAGYRKLTVKASADGSYYSTAINVNVAVNSAVPAVSYAAFAQATVKKGDSIPITVNTDSNAQYLALCSENGAVCKVWSASGNSSVNGNVRTWNVSYAFGGTGSRTIGFKASADGSTYGNTRTASVTVKTSVDPVIPVVNSAAFAQTTVQKGTSVGICVTTSSNSQYLALCSENGAVCKVWSASGNSTVSGNVRTWNVSYSFGGAGNRSIGFKASADGSTYGDIRSAAITVTK